MTAEYQQLDRGVLRVVDGAVLLPDLSDARWLAYVDWVKAGNLATPRAAPPDDLAALRARLRARIAYLRERRETGGFVFRAKTIDSDYAARVRILAAVSAALAALVGARAFSRDWICADGSLLALDAPGMAALGAALAAHDNACAMRARELKAAVLAAADRAALERIDPTAGWPAQEP